MRIRSSSASWSRILLSAALLALGLEGASAQQSSNNLTQGDRTGSNRPDLTQDQALLFAQNQGDLFDIPPVIERPLGLEEGPRVVVREFSLSGAVNREKQNLRVSDINAILGGHARTQPPDGYTINQLQAIADEVTRFYRDRGFILAQAIVPAQEVRDGVVSIQVLEGSLQNVRVEGNNIYKEKVVQGPFRRLQGQPIEQDTIEQALLDVQEFPGLTVFGTFTQGEDLGNTDLVVRVREEKRAYITASGDNYGNEATGEYRATLDFQFNNIFGVADQINGYILQTAQPDNGIYGGLSFRFPFGRNAISLGAASNRFDVGGLENITSVALKGTVEQADLNWNYSFANGRFFGSNARFGIAVKEALTEGTDFILAKDNLTVASLVWDFFKAGRNSPGFAVGSFELHQGIPDWLGSMTESGDGMSSRVGGSGTRAGGKFTKFKFDLQFLRRLGETNSVLLRLGGQYSNDLLVSLEQFSIGGPQNVRAYPVAQALSDSGASATLEWFINAPGFSDKPAGATRTWGEIFQVSLYADYAYGELNDPLISQEETVDFSGYGLGLQFNVPDRFFARFDVAAPITDRLPANGRDPQYYFRLSFTF